MKLTLEQLGERYEEQNRRIEGIEKAMETLLDREEASLKGRGMRIEQPHLAIGMMLDNLAKRLEGLESLAYPTLEEECEHEWKEANTFYFHDHDFSLMKCVKCHETKAVQTDKKKSNLLENEQNN